MSDKLTAQIHSLVEKIKANHTTINTKAISLRTTEMMYNFNKHCPQAWCQAVMGDSLVRLRLFIEQSFNHIETLGIVAVSRYLFELSVWLYLFQLDSRYGFVYYKQLIETQRKFYSDSLKQINQEIKLLRSFEKEEAEEQTAILKTNMPTEEKINRIKILGQKIDVKAARKFSIYAESAKYNGYGYQADLIEKKIKTQIEIAIKELELDELDFKKNKSPKISDLTGSKGRWQWKTMAGIVDLDTEYEYIYTYTSKLLHATPASISTNQKTLALEEILMFLKYIDIKIIDILTLAQNYPQTKSL